MIKNIIFDIGQVLAEFRWRSYLKELGIEGERFSRVAKATVEGPYWNEMDRGVMTFSEIVEACVKLDLEMEEQIRLFFSKKTGLVLEYPYAKPWVLSLKQAGFFIYLLSNYGEVYFQCVKENFGFYPCVDGGVISYEVKKIKPEEEIYQLLLERYALIAEECVFLDDREENIEAAKKLGFQVIHFQNYENAKRELNAILKRH